MNKEKRVIILTLIITLICISVGIRLVFKSYNGYKITIRNNTDKPIEKLEIKYASGKSIKTIEKIEKDESWKYTVNTDEIDGEDSIILIYKDKSNTEHKETLVGYLEKGYDGESSVYASRIDGNGILDIYIK